MGQGVCSVTGVRHSAPLELDRSLVVKIVEPLVLAAFFFSKFSLHGWVSRVKGAQSTSFATGFLRGPMLLHTNAHSLLTPAVIVYGAIKQHDLAASCATCSACQTQTELLASEDTHMCV